MKRTIACIALLTLLGSACSDDGGDVRDTDGTGAPEIEGSSTDDPLVIEAVEQYKAYAVAQGASITGDLTAFTDAVRAGDIEAAKAAYAPSRYAWETIEPIAGLVDAIDGAVDARVDDFEGVDDPAFTGWHRLEYLIWQAGDLSEATPFADQLDADIATLNETLPTLEIPPAAIAVGAGELIEEVSTGKITGEEDRYSHTDLWDFAANVEGSKAAVDFMRPALEAADAALLEAIDADFAELETQLDEYRDGEGYKPYTDLTEDDKTAMTATLASLSENLSLVAGTLGLG